jgi:hypothetical protein
MMVAGMGTSPPDRTWSDPCRVVLPCNEPLSGPKINSALLMSWVVTSLFLIRLLAARYKYLFVLGLPIIF